MANIFFVEGNIGTGKSTFLSLIKKYYPQFQVIYEPVDVWTSLVDKSGCNILQYFYDDPERYAYAFQSLAFFSRMEKFSEIDPSKKAVFIERSIWSDCNVFAKNCFLQGTLSDIEYKIYNLWFSWAENSIKNVDYKHVYLRCEPETSFERSTIRSRREESKIPIEYITQIHNRHEEWMTLNEKVHSTIDVSGEDYMKHEETFKRLFSKNFPELCD